ncbi:MAG: hypothetical protein A3J62_04115 [Candidatus Buchananbacteria bacterium RIFCSPHIGHO2_02_FULL_38_8]|uniref:Uncharacterized protein n=2 Tax=Candidatus Buchananiibacteriota TaxID=1817903 RepID=A0A1G1XYG3_9BACT|nr:hypothetical protein [uncultured bacterium]OGY44357.1 MAG: hypothetical protein A2731_00110 [Candidatus Buchananbacteria bacterium RIFCSPHIGHO2_01_FULL_39_8]OGY47188.1 MAG: hypothetical protein A3J62_04115 [Candidatus Buchananbacteria bacterium RIFCSPHIGHO2_02_FULL_38_8]
MANQINHVRLKNKSNVVNQILNELYELDGSLKKHEKELIKIINKILVSKPDTKFDQAFAKRLRAELLAKTSSKQTTSLLNKLTKLFTMKKLAYVAGGAVLTALILIPVLNSLNQSKFTPTFDTGLKITRVGDNAFGLLEPEATVSDLGLEQAKSAVAPLGLGAGDAIVAPRSQAGGGSGYATSESAMIVPPDYLMVNYKYVYKGEPITLDQDKLPVLKRIRGIGSAGQIAGLLSSFNLGLADLSAFSDSKVQNVSFIQDKPYGYAINANLEEGSLTIYQNWQTWPLGQCQDEKCYEAQRVTISDVPTDEELIRIANDFLSQHKISLENYGDPFVDNNWRVYYAQTVNQAELYLPDSLTVLYPLEIQGQGVYEGYGYPAGLSVTVSIRDKRVNGVNSLFTQNYQSSMYEAETDFNRILKFAETGGVYSYPFADATTVYEIELGEPKLGYLKKWNYKNGQTEELLVPALIFPVINQPQTEATTKQILPNAYKQNVVVPLIKEVLAEFEAGNDDPIRILPMPAPEPLIMDNPAEETNNN